MQLKIRSLSHKLPETILETIERQFQYALSRLDSKVDSIQLTIRDNNGPRGGIDQECRALVRLKDGTRMIVSDVQDRLMAAVSHVADRAGRAVAKRLERRRSVSHVRTA